MKNKAIFIIFKILVGWLLASNIFGPTKFVLASNTVNYVIQTGADVQSGLLSDLNFRIREEERILRDAEAAHDSSLEALRRQSHDGFAMAIQSQSFVQSTVETCSQQ